LEPGWPEAALSEAAGGGVDCGTELVEGAFDLEGGAFDFALGPVDFVLGPFDLVDAGLEEPGTFSACPLPLFSPAAEPWPPPWPPGGSTASAEGASSTPEADREPAEAPEPLPAPVGSTGAAEPASEGESEFTLGAVAVGPPADSLCDRSPRAPIALPPPRPAWPWCAAGAPGAPGAEAPAAARVAPGTALGPVVGDLPAAARAAGALSSVARVTPPLSPLPKLRPRPEIGHSWIVCSERSITKATTAATIVAVPEIATTT
jgi:hypothetical protein